MELRTQRLKVVLQSREEVERMIEAMSEYERAQISADWLARLRVAQEGDPWAYAFRLVLRETDTVVGSCSFKGPPVDGMDAPASKRVLAKCGFEYVGEYVDPEDGVVARFERAM